MDTTWPHIQPAFEKALTCPLCNTARESWHLDAESFGAVPYDRDLFSIFCCNECGLGITDPVPSESDSHLLYEDRTSCDFQGDDSSAVAGLKRAVADHDLRAFTSGFFQFGSALKMLDYACGNGAFALSMRRVFPASYVWAADYHSEAPPMFRNSAIRYVRYEDLPEKGPFDFILCRHVLEHTYDPIKFLREMGALLTPGGILMIEVPNLQAPVRRLFGKHWDGYYVPYHPIHFSAPALRRAVVDAGLLPLKAGGCEMPKVGRSLRNVFGCKYNIALFGAGVLLHPLQFFAGLATGKSTCLRLWAAKP
jgi:SAM-dependent methyltransferase